MARQGHDVLFQPTVDRILRTLYNLAQVAQIAFVL
jgi:hypothetical protein